MSETEQQIEHLQIKLMELENSLGELNAVIIRQAAEIDVLKRSHQRLLDQFDSLQQRRPDPAGEPPPPHY